MIGKSNTINDNNILTGTALLHIITSLNNTIVLKKGGTIVKTFKSNIGYIDATNLSNIHYYFSINSLNYGNWIIVNNGVETTIEINLDKEYNISV